MSFRKFFIAACILAMFGAGLWLRRQAQLRPAENGTRAVSAEEGPIEDAVEATGSVAPLNRVEIKPPIPGRVEQLLADEGVGVKLGQIMAWMSSTDRAAIMDAARAQGAAELKRWEDTYKPTPIVAPLSGVVILRNVVVGETVSASTVLFAMSDTLIVVAQVDESDVGRVHAGMPARVMLDAYPNQPVEGKVFDILHEGKNVSNVITYGVKIKLARTPAFFRSQMTANVRFIAHRKEKAVLVPASAIKENADGRKVVWVPDGPDGKPAPRNVKTGIESSGKIEIISGLSAGETVLLRQGKYVPQQGPQASPLTMGGRPPSNQGQAPRSRKPQ